MSVSNLLASESASLIVFSNHLDPLLDSIKLSIESNPDLYRLLIFTSAEVPSSEKIEKLTDDLRKKNINFNIIDRNQSSLQSIEDYEKIFKSCDADRYEDTKLLQFEPKNEQMTEWASKVSSLHFALLAKLDFSGESFIGSTDSQFDGFKNFVLNIEEFITHPDFRGWQSIFANLPCLVLGAGPSLDSQIEMIRRCQNRMLIIAADTLSKRIEELGIVPHIYCSIERAEDVSELFDDSKDHSHSILCASSWVSPKVLNKYRSTKSLFMPASPINNFLCFKRLQISTGHSCMGLAIRLASALGCPRIYLAGIDLSWGAEGKSHSQMAPYETNDRFADFRKENKKMFNEAIEIPSNSGGFVKSNYVWNLFKDEFQIIINGSSSQFFNLSPSGAKIENCPFQAVHSLEDEIVRIPTDVPVLDILKSKLTYQRDSESRQELKVFYDYLKYLAATLPAIQSAIENSTQENLGLHQHPFWNILLQPLMKVSLLRMKSSQKDVQAFERDSMRRNFKELESFLPPAISNIGKLMEKKTVFY